MARELARRTSTQDPFRDMLGLRDTISGLFEDFLGGRPLTGGRLAGMAETETWSPAVDIRETNDELIVYAALPGVSKEDCTLEVKDSTLILSGRRKEEQIKEDESWLRRELPYGQFYRAFNLPMGVDSNKVKATYKDGILEIHLPKAEEARPHKVHIQ